MSKKRHAVTRNIWNITRIVISIGLLFWLLSCINLVKSLEILKKSGAILFALAVCWMLFSQIIVSFRLKLLFALQGMHISLYSAVRLTFLGLFAGNFLPSTVGGDAVKIIDLTRRGVGKEMATASMVMDRVLNLLATFAVLPTVLFVPRLLGRYAIPNVLIVLVGGVIGIILTIKIISIVSDRNYDKGSRSSWLISWFCGTSQHLYHFYGIMKSRPSAFLMPFGLSLVALSAGFLAFWAVIWNVDVHVSYLEAVAASCVVLIVSLIPISLNGYGIIEVSFVYLLNQLGATDTQALAAAIQARLILLLPSLLGIYAFWSFGKKGADGRSIRSEQATSSGELEQP